MNLLVHIISPDEMCHNCKNMLFFSYMVIILLGRTVTLVPPHGEESDIICGTSC